MENLLREGWHIKDEALQELSHGENGYVMEKLLDADLLKIGRSCLPDDVNRAESKQIVGPLILQVVEAEDVSTPSKGGLNTSKQRLLAIKLTDGKIKAKGMEYKPFAGLKDKTLPPGTKVRVSNASVKAGVILLDEKNFKVLGGHVSHLVEGWDFQRRFGGASAEIASSEDQARAPRFTQFVPGKTKAPSLASVPKAETTSRPPGMGPKDSQAQGNGQISQNATRDGPQGESIQKTRVLPEASQDAAAGLGQARAHGAAKAKLMERLAESSPAQGRFGGRGGRGGRRKGRGRFDDEDDSSLTLAEWEARSKGASQKPTGRMELTDEEMARQLQEQLDMEDSTAHHPLKQQSAPAFSISPAEALKQSMFSFAPPQEESRGRGRGRGRGRSRGRGRAGRA